MFDFRDAFRGTSCGVIKMYCGIWHCDGDILNGEREVRGSGHGINKCTNYSEHYRSGLVRVDGNGNNHGKGYGMGKKMMEAKNKERMVEYRNLMLIRPPEVKVMKNIKETHR